LPRTFALTQSSVQDRLLSLARESARYHAGHVLTPGYSYRLIDPRFYVEWTTIHTIVPAGTTATFIPWSTSIRTMFRFIP